MECFHCDQPAHGSCRFCGRALCKEHMKNMPYIVTVYVGEGSVPKAVVVSDVLYCGICRPQPEPIGMPEIY